MIIAYYALRRATLARLMNRANGSNLEFPRRIAMARVSSCRYEYAVDVILRLKPGTKKLRLHKGFDSHSALSSRRKLERVRRKQAEAKHLSPHQIKSLYHSTCDPQDRRKMMLTLIGKLSLYSTWSAMDRSIIFTKT